MPEYSYRIGTDLSDESMVNLETLGISPPQGSFFASATRALMASGRTKNVGFPVAIWKWGFLKSAQWTTLRGIITSDSMPIYIQTRLPDGTYQAYSTMVTWPAEDAPVAGRHLDFVLQFTHLIPVDILDPEPPPTP